MRTDCNGVLLLKSAGSTIHILDPAAPISFALKLSISSAAYELQRDSLRFSNTQHALLVRWNQHSEVLKCVVSKRATAFLVQVAGLAVAGLKLALLAAVGAAGAHGYYEGRQRLNKVGTFEQVALFRCVPGIATACLPAAGARCECSAYRDTIPPGP